MIAVERTLQALIFQYGEPMVTRWALSGETAYLKRKTPRTKSPRKALEAQLKDMTLEELDALRKAAQS